MYIYIIYYYILTGISTIPKKSYTLLTQRNCPSIFLILFFLNKTKLN